MESSSPQGGCTGRSTAPPGPPEDDLGPCLRPEAPPRPDGPPRSQPAGRDRRLQEQLDAEAERLRLQQEAYTAQREAQDAKRERDLASVRETKTRYERERHAEAREHEEKMRKEQERLRKLEELRKKRHAEVNAEQARRAENFSDFIHDLYGADEEADRFDDYLHNVKAEQFKDYCASARKAAGVPPSAQRPQRLIPPRCEEPAVRPKPAGMPDEEWEVQQTLNSVRSAPLDVRKKRVRELLIHWHPDKHPQDPQRATRVFQFLQSKLADGTFLS